ncbi:MAG: methyltransferase, partial [Armatimonadetes bacterium]|nr:methyltransferase [Armatimonadota bacterium]
MIKAEAQDFLDRLDSAAICDACKRLGLVQRFMDGGIRPVWRGARTVGPAFTLRLTPGQGGCGEAIAAASPGDVLVIDARGRGDAIVWGELF